MTRAWAGAATEKTEKSKENTRITSVCEHYISSAQVGEGPGEKKTLGIAPAILIQPAAALTARSGSLPRRTGNRSVSWEVSPARESVTV